MTVNLLSAAKAIARRRSRRFAVHWSAHVYATDPARGRWLARPPIVASGTALDVSVEGVQIQIPRQALTQSVPDPCWIQLDSPHQRWQWPATILRLSADGAWVRLALHFDPQSLSDAQQDTWRDWVQWLNHPTDLVALPALPFVDSPLLH
ncbi:PilZ domain-containing protein [Sulfobacillus thermosulfidooxidans]|uniref:PilZ domain-containing protein n=1 Tax=Sulfobacillus thermosulfidooxidans TaxID=28034 RepID=UPI0006B52CC5|nr:PilZ domain-containing protein [Sulfobacillus thermosulfidooxidans]